MLIAFSLELSEGNIESEFAFPEFWALAKLLFTLDELEEPEDFEDELEDLEVLVFFIGVIFELPEDPCPKETENVPIIIITNKIIILFIS
jgi:hypothetical protein